MGAYVSRENCERVKSVIVNCTIGTSNDTDPPYTVYGGVLLHEFEAEPDIAGIGVFAAFFGVSSLAILMGLLYLLLQATPWMPLTGINSWSHLHKHHEKRPNKRRSARTTWADVIEGIILSCSDQQLFTSAAYALCLRYSQGCSVSIYHYNIVSSSLLVTCATHLMSVTMVSKYWKHKLVAVIRTALTIALYLVTAILLANSNADGDIVWPADVPNPNLPERKGKQFFDTPLVYPAACLQGGKGAVGKIVRDTFGRGGANLGKVLGSSIPKNNKVTGWNFFLLLVLWYAFAIVAEAVRFFLFFGCARRKLHHAADLVPQSRFRSFFTRSNPWWGRIFWFYQFAGVSFCVVTIVMTGRYVDNMRDWMNTSGWIKKINNTNPEYDPTTFGQMVPLFLSLLTVFVFFQLIGDKFSGHFNNSLDSDEEDSYPGSTSNFPVKGSGGSDGISTHIDRTGHNATPPSGKQRASTVQITSVPSTPVAPQLLRIHSMPLNSTVNATHAQTTPLGPTIPAMQRVQSMPLTSISTPIESSSTPLSPSLDPGRASSTVSTPTASPARVNSMPHSPHSTSPMNNPLPPLPASPVSNNSTTQRLGSGNIRWHTMPLAPSVVANQTTGQDGSPDVRAQSPGDRSLRSMIQPSRYGRKDTSP